MEAKHCLECEEVLHGRSDKKFCNEACRSTYHNRLNATHSLIIRQINRRLNRNRKILEELIFSGQRKVKRSLLLRLGFDFQLLTAIQDNEDDSPCFLCYEYGYSPLDDQYFRILTQQEIQYF